MQAGEALSPPGSPVWGWGWTPPALPCFGPAEHLLLCSWDCSQESRQNFIPGHPSFWGSGGHYPHSQSAPPSWQQTLLASQPCPLSGLVALSATRVSALPAARGREGQTW